MVEIGSGEHILDITVNVNRGSTGGTGPHVLLNDDGDEHLIG